MGVLILVLIIAITITIFYAWLLCQAAYLNQYDEVDQDEDKDSRI